MYLYTMEYYLATKRNEILPFAMDPEGIIPSEINQRKRNTLGFPLYVESKKQDK